MKLIKRISLKYMKKQKNGEIDLLSLPVETLQKMFTFIEEEIKIKKKNNDKIRMKIAECEEKIGNLN